MASQKPRYESTKYPASHMPNLKMHVCSVADCDFSQNWPVRLLFHEEGAQSA